MIITKTSVNGYAISSLDDLGQDTVKQLADVLKHLYSEPMSIDVSWVKRIIDNPDTVLLVARDDKEVIVGTMTATVQYEPLRRGSIIVIGGVVVSPAARGKQLTSHMLDVIVGVAKEYGIDKIHLATTKPAAKHVYQKYGFEFNDQNSAGDKRDHYVYQVDQTV